MIIFFLKNDAFVKMKFRYLEIRYFNSTLQNKLRKEKKKQE